MSGDQRSHILGAPVHLEAPGHSVVCLPHCNAPALAHTHARTHTVCSSSQYESVDGRETVAKRPGFLASCRSASLVGLYCHHPNLSAQSRHCFSFFVCVCVGKIQLVFSARSALQGLRRSKKIYIIRGLLEPSVWE